jgi:hypothetical protein
MLTQPIINLACHPRPGALTRHRAITDVDIDHKGIVNEGVKDGLTLVPFCSDTHYQCELCELRELRAKLNKQEIPRLGWGDIYCPISR